MKIFRAIFVIAIFLAAPSRALAYPILQLDILGGHYDAATQTIVSDGPTFTLVAILTPKAGVPLSTYMNDTFYISAAVSPQIGPADEPLGSFFWNTTNYLVTEDMTYGTPPLELFGAATDPGDLAGHGVYPTFFREFDFKFNTLNKTVSYNSQDDPGGLQPTTATTNISYFQTFNVTTSLIGDNTLHFDLYNSYISGCKKNGSCSLDEDVALFAPFSHDAQSSQNVPEPGVLMALFAGLSITGAVVRRRLA